MYKEFYLNLTKGWFYLILSGIKTSEFRQYKDYYKARLLNKDGSIKQYSMVNMYNGYRTNSPRFLIECKGISVIDHICWGKVFELKLGQILCSWNCV